MNRGFRFKVDNKSDLKLQAEKLRTVGKGEENLSAQSFRLKVDSEDEKKKEKKETEKVVGAELPWVVDR